MKSWLRLLKISRIFYRCVDWNINAIWYRWRLRRRIFYRCVDWNCALIFQNKSNIVASFTDAWIETSHGCPEDTSRASHLLQMRGLKPKSTQRNFKKRCRIFYRCVDWNNIRLLESSNKRVASFTDAWIETKERRHQYRNPRGRIFYRCVDWN